MTCFDTALTRLRDESGLSLESARELLDALVRTYQVLAANHAPGELILWQMLAVIEDALPGIPDDGHLRIAQAALDYAKEHLGISPSS